MNTGVTALPLLIANGITSVREMGGYIDSTRAWQARMKAGTLVGPRIVTPGPILESPRYLEGVVQRSTGSNSQLALRDILAVRAGRLVAEIDSGGTTCTELTLSDDHADACA